jgi:hypothetical protein
MPVIQIAYTCTVPLLFVLLLFHKTVVIAIRLLAVTNLLMIVFSYTVLQQLRGWYLALRSFQSDQVQPQAVWNLHLTALVLVLLMPWAFLIRKIRTNIWYTWLLWIVLIYALPPAYWNTYDLFIRLLMYAFLFCSVYALLWLMKQFPAAA